MDNYKIVARNSSICYHCQKKYQEGDFCISCLREENEEQLFKESYCESCFETQKEQGKFICFWRRQAKIREVARAEFDRVFALNLFFSLGDTSNLKQQKLRYLLALVLTRRKILKWEKVLLREGQEWLILSRTDKRDKREISFPIPSLEPEEIDPLKNELIKVLTSDGSSEEGDETGGPEEKPEQVKSEE